MSYLRFPGSSVFSLLWFSSLYSSLQVRSLRFRSLVCFAMSVMNPEYDYLFKLLLIGDSGKEFELVYFWHLLGINFILLKSSPGW